MTYQEVVVNTHKDTFLEDMEWVRHWEEERWDQDYHPAPEAEAGGQEDNCRKQS